MNRMRMLWLALLPVWSLGQVADSTSGDSTTDVRATANLRVAQTPGQFQGVIRYRIQTRYAGTHAAEYQRDSLQYPATQVTEVHPAGLRMTATGPLFQSTALRTADNQQYVLDSVSQVAWQAPSWSDTLLVVPQAKRETILGYNTRLYHVVKKANRGVKPRVYQQLWIADSLRPAPEFTLYPGIPGLPLRIVTQDNVPFRNQPGTTVTVTVEATAIEPQPLSAERFALPQGWTVKPWDQVAPFGGMGGDRNLGRNGMPQMGGSATGNPR